MENNTYKIGIMQRKSPLAIFFILYSFFFILFSLFFSPVRAQIGTWHNYLAYSDIQQIRAAGSENLFVLASNDLYQYNKTDQSIYTYDKTNGLSDTYITKICWCPQAKRLIAVYQNSNIDLIDVKGNVINISDLYTKAITGDKTVSSIRIDGIYAYLICGFGIVKVNMQRAEIADSYKPSHPDYPKSLPEEDNSDYDKYIDIVKTLKPGGPKYNYFANMKFYHGKLYTVGGGFYQLGNYLRPGTVQVWDNNNWVIYQDDFKLAFANNYLDVTSIAVDPLNENHVVVASCSGLIEFENGIFKNNYTAGNNQYFTSAAGNGDPNYVRTDGVIYDNEGNLYCLNSGATTPIIKWTKDGTWEGINDNALMESTNKTMYVMRGSFFDSQGLMWFTNAHRYSPYICCFDPTNNKVVKYSNMNNQDGINFLNYAAQCACEDKEGNIWLGTDMGPVYLDKERIADSSLGVIQYKVPRNDGTNYADYLLANISINSIAVDGAGRKWFGTEENGVYLISADNNTQIHHFTAENSKLLSNRIESIAINPTTGEVFFGTDKGLCSYISDATETNTEMTTDNVWAYPNPVNPDYTGLITIVGLTYDADVKILSANGAVVAEGKSNGGSFTWNGCDQKGRRVASGIYMVATAKSNGEKGTVCKIAIIR
jgi:hypothetical protein